MTVAGPAGRAQASADQCVRGLLALLGDRDPLAIPAELVGRLERIVRAPP
ncbi:MAG TPA: hypothetical protein VNK43_11720 [Gemmatimonadales bacterium]|nr:hypothetical protein [Gemmatimonadales bacterium]